MKISLEKGCFFLWLGTNVKTAFTIFDKKGKKGELWCLKLQVPILIHNLEYL